MIGNYLIPLLLIIANVTGAAMVFPQVVKLWRTRDHGGISAVGVGLGIAMNLWWIVYGTAVGLWGILPVSVAGTVQYVTIAWLLVGVDSTRFVGRLLCGGAGAGVVPLVGLLLGGWAGAGLAIGLSYGAQFGPAAWTAWRSTNLCGLSPMMWTLAWVEAVVWLAYGLRTLDPALIVGGCGGTLMATLILYQLYSPARAANALPSRSLVVGSAAGTMGRGWDLGGVTEVG